MNEIDDRHVRGLYDALSSHHQGNGIFYFEMYIRAPTQFLTRNTDDAKFWADMVMRLPSPKSVYPDPTVVGIEVKDWSKPVGKSIVQSELEGYKYAFDEFYLAANEFSENVEDIESPYLGLIKMESGYEIIREPSLMPTYRNQIEKTEHRITENWKRKFDEIQNTFPDLVDRVLQPGETSLISSVNQNLSYYGDGGQPDTATAADDGNEKGGATTNE